MWPRFLVYFVAGMCFYRYRRSIPYTTALLGVALAVCVAAACVAPVLVYVLPIAGSYAVLNLGINQRIRLPQIGPRHDLSYGVYLYAYPIQQLLILYLGAIFTPFTLFLTALPLTVGCAALSWFFVERPALDLKRRIQPIGQPQPALSDPQPDVART
jgi:peptidoglycan/LPS O-acetylase OafA/YrhL